MAVLVILISGFTGLSAQTVGESAPDFTYKDTEDVDHTLSSYAGKVVFIFAFGNNCPFCKSVGPDTESKVYQVYGERDDFMAIGLDTWDNSSSVSTVSAFKSSTGITYPLCVKAGSFESLYATTYDRVLVVGQDGVLRHKGSSQVSKDLDNAIAVIDQLLATTSTTQIDKVDAELISAVYPNPSFTDARFKMRMQREGQVELRLYNSLGQELRLLMDERVPAGEQERSFDVSSLDAGIYFIRMTTPGLSFTRKFQVSR